MGFVVSKRRVRSPLLITPGLAVGVPAQAGTPNGTRGAQQRDRPAAAQNWKEGPVTRPEGGASVLRTGGRPRRSFRPLRARHAADLLSLPVAPLML